MLQFQMCDAQTTRFCVIVCFAMVSQNEAFEKGHYVFYIPCLSS